MQKTGKLDSLTGLRFFAALAIFFIHVVYFTPTADIFRSALAKEFLPACSAGVCLFFLLSGFLLAYTHADISITTASLYKFWTSRAARVYPVYFLALILYGPFILAHRFLAEPAGVATKKSIASLLPSVFLVQSWGHPRFAIAWNGPGWSLSVEAALYLAFPWITGCLAKLTQRSLSLIIIALVLLSFGLTIGASQLLGGWAYGDMLVNFNPLFHLPTFAIGIALGCHFLNSSADYSKTKWLPVLGFVSIGVLAVVAPRISPVIAHNSLFVLPFAVLIYGLARGGKLSGIFSIPLFVLLGEASYSFYILQFPIGSIFRWINERAPWIDLISTLPGKGMVNGIWAAIACLIFLIGMSILSYFSVEIPLRRFLLDYLQRGGRVSIDRIAAVAGKALEG